MVHKQRYILLSYLLPSYVVAFGPRLDFVTGGHGFKMNRSAVVSKDDFNENQEHEHRDMCRRYNTQRNKDLCCNTDTNNDFFHKQLFATEPFIVDPAMFGIDNPFDTVVSDTAYGIAFKATSSNIYDVYYNGVVDNDCDVECSIPEAYKLVDQPIDVLKYLGIQRVQPVRTTIIQ